MDIFKRPLGFKHFFLVLVGGLLFLFIFVGLTGNKQVPVTQLQPATQSTPTDEVKQASPAEKQAAQKELDEVIALANKAGLVTSYEFSADRGWTVYIGNVWYTQTVQFKKDFLAKIAILKHTITGYKFFEIRDAYSNEKVAEVTAFSGSLEVYK